jgi:hypothetical protein
MPAVGMGVASLPPASSSSGAVAAVEDAAAVGVEYINPLPWLPALRVPVVRPPPSATPAAAAAAAAAVQAHVPQMLVPSGTGAAAGAGGTQPAVGSSYMHNTSSAVIQAPAQMQRECWGASNSTVSTSSSGGVALDVQDSGASLLLAPGFTSGAATGPSSRLANGQPASSHPATAVKAAVVQTAQPSAPEGTVSSKPRKGLAKHKREMGEKECVVSHWAVAMQPTCRHVAVSDCCSM